MGFSPDNQIVCCGLNMMIAENGQIGMDILNTSLHTKPFDLVLMDIQLTVIDGLTLTKFSVLPVSMLDLWLNHNPAC
jgi:DNA-binding LytR/AlgR family response regulator